MGLDLTEIRRYPVKSCRGESLPHAEVEPWGLAGDRRWMVVDADGAAVTAREINRLLLVRPELREGGLHLTSPDAGALDVATPDGEGSSDGAELVTVDIWGTRIQAARAGDRADAWFGRIVGAPVRLVYLDDPTRRRMNPARTRPEDRVSFADGHPLHLISEESLAALNEHIAAGPRAEEGPLPATRFRPNLVVRGAPAWAEDDWRRIRVGDAVFRVVKGCERCVLTTIDPDTARRGKEPIATLARTRRWDGSTWFGVDLVPDTGKGVGIGVGDEIGVISAVRPGDGPLR